MTECSNFLTSAYWKAACAELKKPSRLALAALFCALSVVVGGITINITVSVQIHFTFFIVALGAAIYGPVCGMVVAAVADLLNYILFLSAYPYFPGYMISEMLVALLFGLLLYRQKITLSRLFIGKALMNFPINVGLGSLWSWMLYDKAYLYYFWEKMIKNTLLLPLEVMALAAFFGLMIPILARMRLLPAQEERELRRLRFGSSALPTLGMTSLVVALIGCYYAWVMATLALWILAGFLLAAGIALLIAAGIINKKRTE